MYFSTAELCHITYSVNSYFFRGTEENFCGYLQLRTMYRCDVLAAIGHCHKIPPLCTHLPLWGIQIPQKEITTFLRQMSMYMGYNTYQCIISEIIEYEILSSPLLETKTIVYVQFLFICLP